MLTILTYALFTGLSFFAQTWWQLLIFRFLAALGIGGEWAVGASLLSETWPRRWRPWMAAVLQTGVNLGVMLAAWRLSCWPASRTRALSSWSASCPPAWSSGFAARSPSPRNGSAPSAQADQVAPGFLDLFRGDVRRTTLLTLLVCSLTLTAHWAFMFWYMQHLRNLPELSGWDAPPRRTSSSATCDLAGDGGVDRRAISSPPAGARGSATAGRSPFCAWAISLSMARDLSPCRAAIRSLVVGLRGDRALSQGLFALFTMYLPPLFPTLLRTTGAGLLLQHRPHRRRARHRLLRPVLQRGRLSPGAPRRGVPVPPRRRLRLDAARPDRRAAAAECLVIWAP